MGIRITANICTMTPSEPIQSIVHLPDYCTLAAIRVDGTVVVFVNNAWLTRQDFELELAASGEKADKRQEQMLRFAEIEKAAKTIVIYGADGPIGTGKL